MTYVHPEREEFIPDHVVHPVQLLVPDYADAAATTDCKTCGTPTDDLALFPGGICLDCYKQTPAATAPITARDLARMWGAK